MSTGGPSHACCTITVPGFSLLAQETDASTRVTTPEMGRPAESSNVLYQVMAVILVIWLGLALYLFLIDRRVTRLEKSMPDKPGKDS
jgi:CcmD family protein